MRKTVMVGSSATAAVGLGLTLAGPAGWFVLIVAGGMVSAGITGASEAYSTKDEDYELSSAATNIGKAFVVGSVSSGACFLGGQAISAGGNALLGTATKTGAVQLSNGARVSVAATKGLSSGVINTATQHLADTVLPTDASEAQQKKQDEERSYLRSALAGAVGGAAFEGLSTYAQKGASEVGKSVEKAGGVDGRAKTLAKKAYGLFSDHDISADIKASKAAKIALKAVDGIVRGGASATASALVDELMDRRNQKRTFNDLLKRHGFKILYQAGTSAIQAGQNKYDRLAMKGSDYEAQIKAADEALAHVKQEHQERQANIEAEAQAAGMEPEAFKKELDSAYEQLFKELEYIRNLKKPLYLRGTSVFGPGAYDTRFPFKTEAHGPSADSMDNLIEAFQKKLHELEERLKRKKEQLLSGLQPAKAPEDFARELHEEREGVRLAQEQTGNKEKIIEKLNEFLSDDEASIDEYLDANCNMVEEIDIALNHVEELSEEMAKRGENNAPIP